MDELKLRVGDTLRLETAPGVVVTFRVTQMILAPGGRDPAFVTTTPYSGRVTLTLHAEAWPQDVDHPDYRQEREP